MEKDSMVDTEFLFALQPRDKHYGLVSRILERYSKNRSLSIRYPVSAILEIREVMAGHQKNATERLEALAFIRAKTASLMIRETELSSDDLILCEEMLAQHRFLTYFDGLHASVSLNRKLPIVSNDKVYDEIGVKRISFEEFLAIVDQ
jgi:predicted nucleic acid-binding protein